MTYSLKPPNPRRELDALDKRIYELERRLRIKQTDLNYDRPQTSNAVVTEIGWGQSPAIGTKKTQSRGDHTHGTPTDPIPAHVAGTPHGGGTVTSVTGTAPITSTGGNTPAIGATVGQAINTLAAGDDNRFPTAAQKAALAGTTNPPADTNRYVTDQDARNTNARTPVAHATTHNPGGADAVATATAGSSAPGNAASAGTAGSLARSDHVHGREAYGSSAGTVAQGNDPRFSDSRPPSGAASGDLTGSYPSPSLAVDRVRLAGDTMTGQLIAPSILTGSAAGNSFVQNADYFRHRWVNDPANSHRFQLVSNVSSSFATDQIAGLDGGGLRLATSGAAYSTLFPLSGGGLAVRRGATVSGDTQQWQNSAGTVLAKIPSDGVPAAATDLVRKQELDTKVSTVTGTSPVVSSGGTAPVISMPAATSGAAGHMSAADKAKLDGLGSGSNVVSVNGRTGVVVGLAEDNAVVHLAGTETIIGTKSISSGAKLKFNTPDGNVYSLQGYNAVAGGGAGGGIVWTDETTGQTQVATCKGSAYLDVGPNLLVPGSGKRIRIGVNNAGAASDLMGLVFDYITGFNALIQCQAEGAESRSVLYDSGSASGFDSAFFYLNSAVTGTPARILAFADIVTANSAYQTKTHDLFVRGTKNAVFGTGAYTNRGGGSSLQLFYDPTNDIGHIACISEDVAWRELRHWASVHGFYGGVAIGYNVPTSASWDSLQFAARNDGGTGVARRAGIGIANAGYGHTGAVEMTSDAGVVIACVNGALSGYIPIYASAFTVNSSMHSKSAVISMTSSLSKVRGMRPVKFDRPLPEQPGEFRGMPHAPADLRSHKAGFLGFIAEEMADIAPEVISWREQVPGEPVVPDGIDIAGVLALAVKAIQELSAKVELLEARPI